MKYSLILLSVFIIFTSCKKDEYTYSGSYSSQSFKIKKIRLFTNNVEITDQTKILEFLKRKDNEQFIKNYDSIIDVSSKFRIEYLSENQVNIYYGENCYNRNVIEKGDFIFYEAAEVSTKYNLLDQPFSERVLKLSPIFSETIPVAIFTGFASKTSYKHCYYARGQKEIIEMPLLSFLYSRYNSNNNFSIEAMWNINNEFNPSSLIYLTDIDTLAIQEFDVVLKKQ